VLTGSRSMAVDARPTRHEKVLDEHDVISSKRLMEMICSF
jgi:hypothetical protein